MLAIMRSEWVKARSTWSILWTLALTFAISVGLGVLVAVNFRDPSMVAEWDELKALFASFYSLTLGQLTLVTFAVVLVGSEFSTGTIRASLLAVPGRGRFFLGKISTLTVILLVSALITVAATFLAVQAFLGPYSVSITQGDVPLAFAGAVAYLTLISLFAAGVTALLRSSIAALAILLPLLFLNSSGLANIPAIKDVAQYLPDQAGMSLMHMVPIGDPSFSHDYGPAGGLGILLLWVAAALIGGYLVIRRKEV